MQYINKDIVKQESKKRNTLQQAKVVGYGQEVNGEETVNVLLVAGNSDSQTQQNTDVLKNVPIELSDGSSVKEALQEGDLVTVAFFEEDYSSPHIINSFSGGNRSTGSGGSSSSSGSSDYSGSAADFQITDDPDSYGNQKVGENGMMIGDSSDKSGWKGNVNQTAGESLAEQNNLNEKWQLSNRWYTYTGKDINKAEDGLGVHLNVLRVDPDKDVFVSTITEEVKKVHPNSEFADAIDAFWEVQEKGFFNATDAISLACLESNWGDSKKDSEGNYLNYAHKWSFISIGAYDTNPDNAWDYKSKSGGDIHKAILMQFEELFKTWITKGHNTLYKIRFNKNPGVFSTSDEWPWKIAQQRDIFYGKQIAKKG